jgi:hypothetical protein
MQLVLNSLALRASRLRTPFLMLAAALLLGVALAGCKANPAALYKTGYDKRLTAASWAARAPDEAVVIIGGSPSVWQKSGEKTYTFETQPRFRVGLFGGYDAALVKAGTYQLETIVGADGHFADFSGFRWSTADSASDSVLASFEVGPGQVVYVGNLEAVGRTEELGDCWAYFSVSNSSPHVIASFAKKVPYVAAVPTTALLTVMENSARFHCPM